MRKHDPGITIDIFGQTPVQAEGEIGGHTFNGERRGPLHYFYFKARGNHWFLEVFPAGFQAVAGGPPALGWPEPIGKITGEHTGAGHLSHVEALHILAGALRDFLA